MTLPFLIVLGSVVLGALVGLAPGLPAGSLRAARTVALAAALTVVLARILPESAAEVGAWVVLPLVLGGVAPLLLERRAGRAAGRGEGRQGRDLAVELGFAGLLVHQFLDGAVLAGTTDPAARIGVAIAIGAHTLPLVAVLVSGMAEHASRVAAAVGAGTLAASLAAGVLAATWAYGSLLPSATPWVGPAVGGLILHVILHDPARGGAGRGVASDLAATVLGVGLTVAALWIGDGLAGPGSRTGVGWTATAVGGSLAAAATLVLRSRADRSAGRVTRSDRTAP